MEILLYICPCIYQPEKIASAQDSKYMISS